MDELKTNDVRVSETEEKAGAPIYYVCRYTPVELLEGFGFHTERLDPAPLDFTCADSCAHPNLCGFGKAVLEETVTKGLRRLLLVDCCDVCRRIYDILRARGDMEFLYLLPLPHKNGAAEKRLFMLDLARLSSELGALNGMSFDAERALDVWKKADAGAEIPHLTVAGAHGGKQLIDALKKESAMPVVDETCSGLRRLPEVQSPDGDFYLNEYAAALLDQPDPCMRMQFGKRAPDETAAGVVFHTMKFCDYYGFQYSHFKKETDVPLLKIETDGTSQSSGQLQTRIEAFLETIGSHRERTDHTAGADRPESPGRGEKGDLGVTARGTDEEPSPGCRASTGPSASPSKSAALYAAGIDSGSASTDAVILNGDGQIVGSAILPTGAAASSGAEKALETALRDARLQRDQMGMIVATGYGRRSVPQGDMTVTEITCHARGARHLYPEARTVIDIGGQDSKVILLDEQGEVRRFAMNDKCAAGTGRFLEMMARAMELSLSEFSRMGLNWRKPIRISSMCTVFAESEVVSLIAENTAPEDIIHGLNVSVASKTDALIKRADGRPPYIMTGGVSRNPGVVRALEEKLGTRLFVPEEAPLCGALGAALIGLDALREGRGTVEGFQDAKTRRDTKNH